jgi:hypothetical protein
VVRTPLAVTTASRLTLRSADPRRMAARVNVAQTTTTAMPSTAATIAVLASDNVCAADSR